MTAAKLYRWRCERCGRGTNAPSRLNRDDVRRYCLPCSAQTGRLVERTAPVLDAKRTARRAAYNAKARTARAAERRQRERVEEARRSRRVIAGFDVDAEARRMWNLPVFRQSPRWQPQPPPIRIRRTTRHAHTTGHSSYSADEVVMTVGRDEVEALGVLLHELVHPIVGTGGPGGQLHHPPQFWHTLCRAARQAWPDATFPFHEMETVRRGYDRQRLVTVGLRDWLATRG